MDMAQEGDSLDSASNHVFNQSIRITVTNPQKVGSFITSFVTYRINSTANLNQSANQNTSVTRRFNDFILLYRKLHYKYAHVGRIIPPPPDKDFGGMVSVMVTSEADISRMEFVEKRRAALERFLNRLSSHWVIKEDIFFKIFLESKTNYKKTIGDISRKGNLTGSVHGLSFPEGLFLSVMDDESWFHRKITHLESYQETLRVFSEALHEYVLMKKKIGKDIGDATGHIARRLRMISSYEEDPQFSTLLNKLAEGHKDIENVHLTQSEQGSSLLSEVIYEYIKFTLQAKAIFEIREKAFKDVQQVEGELENRRQKEAWYLNSRNTREVQKYRRLREQTEQRLERYIQIFLEISRTIKEEVTHFEQLRVRELKAAIRHWVSNSSDIQEQIINIFKDYLKIDEASVVV